MRRSWSAVRERRISLEQLFLLGIFGALAASLQSSISGTGAIYYEIVSVLVAVYTLGQILVGRQRIKVQTSLRQLIDSSRTAVFLTCCGKRRVVPVSELEAGDKIVVEMGRRSPIDGIVVEGSAYVQEIAQTGEPFPRAKSGGDAVLEGTLALDGDLVVSVSNPVGKSSLEQIERRLEIAMKRPSSWQREADRWMTWFVPTVAALAVGTLVFWLWRATWPVALFNALAVLLVACPCGLGLGVPIALSRAMHRLARLGIVPHGGDLVEGLARVQAVVFDKTGTLTEEQIHLQELVVIEGIDIRKLRSQLAFIEGHCDHPVARPFSALLAKHLPRANDRLTQLRTLPGQGIVACVVDAAGESHKLVIGNGSLLEARHEAAKGELVKAQTSLQGGFRELFVFENDRLIAMALLGEKARSALAVLMPKLKGMGLQISIMTGDQKANETWWTANGLPITGGMSPAEKALRVTEMEKQGNPVLFVGDGLNDSEAMAAATSSLALSTGDSTALAHSQGEVSGASLHALPEAIAISRGTRSNVRLILGISLSYNGIGLILASSGLLHPVAAAVIMFASSLTVVALAGRSPHP
ncbi:MAG: heavy metal translocating P-type ATPase [Chthoniobacteraceae bacterium]